MIPCPECGGNSRVIRARNDGPTMNRLRRCLECGTAFHTAEHVCSEPQNRNQGSSHPNSVLLDHDVLRIRLSHAEGKTITELSRQYGVSHRTIRDITTGRTWKHLPN